MSKRFGTNFNHLVEEGELVNTDSGFSTDDLSGFDRVVKGLEGGE